MPTEKQMIRDKEYYGDYQKKSPYTIEQWEKILTNNTLVNSTELSILKEIFASANHAATLNQLTFRHKKDTSYFVDKMNHLAEQLGKPNGISSDIDLEGNEYWWFLLFWGRNTKTNGLEWKLIPELAEAMEYIFPDLENAYQSYMSEIERSEQTRYSQEDSVWIASSLLLYEKFYTEHPTDIYDLLLMQYEVQQRAQKIHGQDVDVDIITDNCNADSPRCLYPYLRDIDKYWRITFPGEIEDAQLRPEKIDYHSYVSSRFGYIKLSELCEFIETDYCKIADPNYIEIDEQNPFYKMISFLREHGKTRYMDLASPTEEDIERFLVIKEQGKEALTAFHSIGQILTDQYPSFIQKEKAGWLERDNVTIRNSWMDSYVTPEFENTGSTLSVLTGCSEESNNKIIISLVLSFPIESPELTDQVMEKCNNLTVLTSANFRVDKTIRMDTMYSTTFGNAIAAYTSFEEQTLLDSNAEEIILQFETAIQILASYYLDICETLYHQEIPEEEEIHMKPSAEPISVLQTTPVPSVTGNMTQSISGILPVKKRHTNRDNHPDRKDSSFTLYPKNILLQGQKKCGKSKQAIQTAVGIIEKLSFEEIIKEDYEEVQKRYHRYQEEGRILYTVCNDTLRYENWIEGPLGEGIFTSFSNRISEGNFVCIMKEMNPALLSQIMGDVSSLLDEKKREGQPEYETVSLLSSLKPFSIPSNLYLIGTTDLPLTSLENIDNFQVKHIDVKEDSLTNLVIKGIPLNYLLTTMNKRLAYLLGPDYQIGQLFFAPLQKEKTIEKLGEIMYEKILPLILSWMEHTDNQSLFHGNPYEGAHFIFGDFKKSSPDYEMILAETICGEEIFGGDLEVKDKVIYKVQKDAFYRIDSYLELE